MANEMNAPGGRPSASRVEEVARRAIELEDSDDPVPQFLWKAIADFLMTNPADSNFLLDIKAGDPGNPFGTATCMEDFCWNDVLLTADPQLSDGGRCNGFGSLQKYVEHCAEPKHKQARDARLVKQGLSVPSSARPEERGERLSQPGPSSSFASSSHLEPSTTHFSSPATHRSTLKGQTHAAVSSSPIMKSEPLQEGSQRVNMSSPAASINSNKGKNKSKQPTIISLLDSDDEDEVVFAGSSQNSVKRETPKWELVWKRMTIPEKMDALKKERKCLRKAHDSCEDASLKKTMMARRNELRALSAGLHFQVWQPPSAALFKAIPFDKYDMSDALRATIDAPPSSVTEAAVPANLGGGRPFDLVSAPRPMPLYGGPHATTSAGPVVPPLPRSIRDPADMSGRTTDALQAVNTTFGGLLNGMKALAEGASSLFAHGFGSGGIGDASPASSEDYGFFFSDAQRALQSRFGPDMDVDSWFGGGYERDRPADLNAFFKDSLDNFAEDATIDEGLKILKLDSLQDKLPGANFVLLPHQVLGVSFMVKREERETIRGGLLCDAMGLGKTVQCIGLMLARDERPDDFKGCPQLIIAPLALLNQWKSEIERHAAGKKWKICIHHGQGRAKSSTSLKKHDIVLTTFGTLSAESGLKTKAQRKQTRQRRKEQGSDYDSEDEVPNKKGPLFRVKWFRVTVDEAHQMRNRQTKTAKSVLALDCLHPWILTGTPIVNTLADLGPPLVFTGKVSFEEFHKKIVSVERRRPKLASQRAQAALRGVMLRRNKDTEVDGKRILNLPPKTTNMEPLHFEPEERAIYAAIEQRARVRVNKFIKQGTLLKHYSVVLVLLTRLRQCVNHPWLLRRKEGEAGREDDMLVDDDVFTGNVTDTRENDADEYGRAVALLGKEAVDLMAKKLEDRHKAMSNESSNGDDIDMECSICYEPFANNEFITSCKHLFCRTCLDNLFVQPARDASLLSDEESQRGCRACPMCRTMIEPGRVFRAKALWHPPVDEKPEIEEAEEDQAESSTARSKGKKRAASVDLEFFDKKPRLDKGKDKVIDLDADEDADMEDSKDDLNEVVIPPSTKMRRILELIQGYIAEDPNTKIIIFSQFVQFLDLLGSFFELNSVRYTGYRGSMSQNERDESIRRFSMPSSIADPINVILISTKAGGVGLNLTMATKVIMADLAYSPTTEAQAVDRAHRIGQTKEVTVERLVIQDTVEDRLLEIQERKGLLADGALGEGAIGKLGRLSEKDISFLFGIGAEMQRED